MIGVDEGEHPPPSQTACEAGRQANFKLQAKNQKSECMLNELAVWHQIGSHATPGTISLLPRGCRAEGVQSGLPPTCRACIAILFSLFLRLRSSASHKWQNSHSEPPC